jgi:hypothetical protein
LIMIWLKEFLPVLNLMCFLKKCRQFSLRIAINRKA